MTHHEGKLSPASPVAHGTSRDLLPLPSPPLNAMRVEPHAMKSAAELTGGASLFPAPPQHDTAPDSHPIGIRFAVVAWESTENLAW